MNDSAKPTKRRTYEQLNAMHLSQGGASNHNPELGQEEGLRKRAKEQGGSHAINSKTSRQNKPTRSPARQEKFELLFTRKIGTPRQSSEPQIQHLKGGELNEDYKMLPEDKIVEQRIEELLADDETCPSSVRTATVEITDPKGDIKVNLPLNPSSLSNLNSLREIEDESLRNLMAASKLLLSNQPLLNPHTINLVKSPTDFGNANPEPEQEEEEAQEPQAADPNLREPEEEKASEQEEEEPKGVPEYISEVINIDDYSSEDQVIQTQNTNQMFKKSMLLHDRIYCNQQVLHRRCARATTAVAWLMYNVDLSTFFNKENEVQHCFVSPVFSTDNGHCWQMKFIPKQLIPPEDGPQPARSGFSLVAIPTKEEVEKGRWERKVSLSLWHHFLKNRSSLNTWAYYPEFTSDEGDPSQPVVYTVENFAQLNCSEERLQEYEMHRQICMGMHIEELPEGERQAEQPFKGLVNEGTTCYINSLIQTLFFIRPFRNAIYKMPTVQQFERGEEEDSDAAVEQEVKLNKSIPFCIQRIFYNLQEGSQDCVRTHELLRAFGWSQQEQNMQQDVDEFSRKLADQLETMMEKTEVEGTYNKLFEGKYESVVKCMNVDFESKREETFNSLSLTVKESASIEDSIKAYLAPEELTGENQYQTDNHGKQDAKKFIRFKSLPPVLQLQLNRYDFDMQYGTMIKNNKKFRFSEILDLEPIIVQAEGGRCIEHASDAGEEEVVNRYHLHAILIHRGTVTFGHYYAFIKPYLDDRWFEFNDQRVEEVSKDYAISQGNGGSNFLYRLHRNAMGQTNFHLTQEVQDQNANAYMLIYVREKERAEFMSDKLSLDQQIPIPLQQHFRQENLIFNTIQADFERITTHRKVVFLTEETAFRFNYDSAGFGRQICSNSHESERESFFYHLMYVKATIKVNEFIRALKAQFFPDDVSIALEDIWVYRVVQNSKTPKINVIVPTYQQTFCKYQYDLKRYHECPLFQSKHTTAKEYFDKKLDTGKSRMKNTINQVTLYVTLNPEKRGRHRLLRPISKKETNEQQAHFDSLKEFIKKTDMESGAVLINQCSALNSTTYRINQLASRAEPTFVKHSFERLQHIISKIRRHIFIESPDEFTEQEEEAYKSLCEKEDKEEVVHSDSETTSFNSPKVVEDNSMKFGFFGSGPNKLFDEGMIANSKSKPSSGTPIKEDEEQLEASDDNDNPEGSSNCYLLLVKVMDVKHQRLSFVGEVWARLDRPFPKQKIREKLGDLPGEPFFFIDALSKSSILTHAAETSQNGHQGLSTFPGYECDYYEIHPDKNWMMGQVFNKKREGAFINVICQPDIDSREKATRLYKEVYGYLIHRFQLNLCLVRPKLYDSKQDHTIFTKVYEFNCLDEMEIIMQRIATYCKEELELHVDPNYIQMFDRTYQLVPYSDIFRRKALQSYPLFELLCPQNYLNFRLLSMDQSKADLGDNIEFQVFVHTSIRPYKEEVISHWLPRKEYSLREFKTSVINRLVKENPADAELLVDTNKFTFVGAIVHRETNTIQKFLDLKKTTGEAILGEPNKMTAFDQNRPLFRLVQVDLSNLEALSGRNQSNLMMGVFQIYSHQYQRIGSQFVIPLMKPTVTVSYIYEMVKQKLEIFTHGPENMLMNLDPEQPFGLRIIKYHYTYKEGRSHESRIITGFNFNEFPGKSSPDLGDDQESEDVLSALIKENETDFRNLPDLRNSLYEHIYFIVHLNYEP